MTDGFIEGYEAPIHRGIWQRILTWGAPRWYSSLWVVLCLYAALLLLVVVSPWWMLLPLGIWPVGQGIMILLTTWDTQWDDVLITSVKYRGYYEQG
jgi:type IV secretory pathway TrbD component